MSFDLNAKVSTNLTDVLYVDCGAMTLDFMDMLDDDILEADDITCLSNGFYAVCEGYSWDGSC